MKLKKIITLSIFLLLLSNSYSSEVKEIKPLEEYSSEILSEVKSEVKNMNNNSKKEINNVEKKDNKNNIKIENINDEVDISSIVDIYEKTSKDDIVFREGETKPFTGKFGIVLDEKIEYYEEYKDGLLDGETAWFSRKTGNKLLSEFYTKAKLDGKQRTFYENGKIKSIVFYKNNKVEGIIAYNEEGKVVHKSIFKDGNGIWKFFWNNGKISENGKYSSWKKDGVWKKYRKDGSLEKTTTYDKGKILKQIWE